MTESLTQATQDYLKAIYDLLENHSTASTTALAARLGVAPATVTGMLQKLGAMDPPLINYRKHQGATLTPEGQRAALEVIRHHRLLEAYLVRSLGYTWDTVHSEADRLEHFISEDLEARIAASLGNPERDPHGELIPTIELIMPAENAIPLITLRPHQKAKIIRVKADDPDLLKHIESIGLTPGVRIEILSFSKPDRVLEISIENNTTPVIVGEIVSNRIFIEVDQSTGKNTGVNL